MTFLTSQEQNLLQEILPTPSKETLSHRFDDAQERADCNGKCVSGACRTISQ